MCVGRGRLAISLGDDDHVGQRRRAAADICVPLSAYSTSSLISGANTTASSTSLLYLVVDPRRQHDGVIDIATNQRSVGRRRAIPSIVN